VVLNGFFTIAHDIGVFFDLGLFSNALRTINTSSLRSSPKRMTASSIMFPLNPIPYSRFATMFQYQITRLARIPVAKKKRFVCRPMNVYPEPFGNEAHAAPRLPGASGGRMGNPLGKWRENMVQDASRASGNFLLTLPSSSGKTKLNILARLWLTELNCWVAEITIRMFFLLQRAIKRPAWPQSALVGRHDGSIIVPHPRFRQSREVPDARASCCCTSRCPASMLRCPQFLKAEPPPFAAPVVIFITSDYNRDVNRPTPRRQLLPVNTA